MLSDYGKLILLLTGMVLGSICSTVLLITEVVPSEAGVALLTATLVAPMSYATGNGVLARRQEAPSPMLVPLVPKYATNDVEREQSDA